MTTIEANVASIFEDAHRMKDAALERLAAGDYHDAAEKGWYAALRATEAFVLARTGQEPGKPIDTSVRLGTICVNDQSLRELRTSYSCFHVILWEECILHEYCDPEEIDRLVREAVDYVRDCERLAQG